MLCEAASATGCKVAVEGGSGRWCGFEFFLFKRNPLLPCHHPLGSSSWAGWRSVSSDSMGGVEKLAATLRLLWRMGVGGSADLSSSFAGGILFCLFAAGEMEWAAVRT